MSNAVPNGLDTARQMQFRAISITVASGFAQFRAVSGAFEHLGALSGRFFSAEALPRALGTAGSCSEQFRA
eukprot:15468858-Alexandrium_andersonii.AAC.1